MVRDAVVTNNTAGLSRVLPSAEPGAPLTPEALSVLPEELCGELENALILLDVDRVTALIRRVSEMLTGVGGDHGKPLGELGLHFHAARH